MWPGSLREKKYKNVFEAGCDFGEAEQDSARTHRSASTVKGLLVPAAAHKDAGLVRSTAEEEVRPLAGEHVDRAPFPPNPHSVRV